MNDVRDDPQTWRDLAQQFRVDSIRVSSEAGSGHPTSSLSAAELMSVLVAKYFHYQVDKPKDQHNDHLIFSKGHASPLYYSILKAIGAIDEAEFMTYRRRGSRLEGHPTPVLPWVDVATGSLGQGLPIGVGVALAGKMLDRLPYRTWILCGDSEMAEGSMWEALAQASYDRLAKLTAIVDVNRLGQTGPTRYEWDLDLYADRFRAFGWHTVEIDGHDVEAVDQAYAEAVGNEDRPTAIIARTIKGKGVSAVADKLGMHGKPVDDEAAALAELGPEKNMVLDTSRPGHIRRSQPFRGRRADPAALRAGPEGGHAQGVRRCARGAGQGRSKGRGARRRGRQLHLHGDVRQGVPRALLPDVHRRAADARRRRGHAGPRLEAVLGHVRRVPQSCL